jgi:hypothetical protein
MLLGEGLGARPTEIRDALKMAAFVAPSDAASNVLFALDLTPPTALVVEAIGNVAVGLQP